MTTYKYSYQGDEENIAKAVLLDAPISMKKAIEICSRLRGKSVERAKDFLEQVKNFEKAVKFTRFTEGAGHKKGIGPGKFPIKAAEQILNAIKSAESNAISKGLGSNLKIVHISAQKAATPFHQGRQRRITMKRTHIEVVLKEKEIKQPKKQETKSEKKEVKND